jgi:hypothetical protein
MPKTALGRRFAALNRGRQCAALDRHVAATLFFRAWGLLAGVITMVLIPVFLQREEQGYYFTFSSLVSLQIFFELGFNYVLSQLVSHELAAIGSDSSQAERHIARLSSLLRLSTRWYRRIAIAFGATALVVGLSFFSTQHGLGYHAWAGPWAWLVGGAAMNLYFSPRLAIAEGAGRFGDVSRLRLRQSVLGYGTMWLLLACGAGLWAAAAVPLWGAVLTASWTRQTANLGLPSACVAPSHAEGTPSIHWKTEIFPFQWRIAVSWVSGYFIFQLFNPFLFANQGPVIAGQTGLALAAYTAILSLGMSWVNAKTPSFSTWIARGDRATLNSHFQRVLGSSVAFTILATGVLLLVVHLLRRLDMPIATHIADMSILMLLGATTVLNNLVGGMAIYMRCHKEEPMLANSVLTGVLTFAGVAIGSRVGAIWPFAAYLAVTAVVSLPWTIVLFRSYWKRTSS